MKIYLDNAASTKVDEKVLKKMIPYFSEKFGNASSQHQIGQEAKNALETLLFSLNEACSF
jgi:cysteine desulfurase